jgi:hypothetical protein
MKKKGDLAPPRPIEAWTGIDDYLGALARRRTARSKREPKLRRTEPETPRLLLSTVPFLVLIAALAVLAVAIMIAAWPGNQPRPQVRPAEHQQGYAPKGWFQEAQKEFH